jgi:hypothetical protein
MSNAPRNTTVERLWVAHWPDPDVRAQGIAAGGGPFVVETCLRRLAVTADRNVAAALAALRPPEIYCGLDAYQFLLEVMSGLKSAVPGETNVFGQVRRAWESHCRLADHRSLEELGPLIARATADTRRIRREYLQNIGGASYGPLVRRLLRPQAGERILLVGAGELAKSILPFFRAFPIGIWNRRRPGPAFALASVRFEPGDGARAADWAHHVVMTTPADAATDERWMRWLGQSLVQSVVHLGRRRSDAPSWPAHVRGFDLDDLIDLRRTLDNVRSLQIERARLACRETALRFLAPPDPAARRLAAG